MTADVEGLVLGPEWESDRQIALRLSRAWPAFFARFGRLTDVQRAVVEPILDGTSILVCAPTAAGKTEAACAPLMERSIGNVKPWTVLYISPTRALVNDLYERLREPVTTLGLRIARRTGDYHDPLDPQPHVLLTTPESFDSLLCRGRTAEGHVLAPVSAVVLDEVHLMYGTDRGEQLRWLLLRLQRLRDHACAEGWSRDSSLQIVGLSATVPDKEAVLRAYFPTAAVACQLSGGREIELVSADGELLPLDDALPNYARNSTANEKILVFCNARKRVDVLAAEMAPTLEALGFVVRGHHGSLAQPERELAERSVKNERKIVLFATSTLEIGVDIGDIDLVVLDGPPPDISSFLQRIGRGNRRTDKTRVMLCAESKGDAVIQLAMLEAARASYLGPAEGGPHYSVVRQQIASYIFQGPNRHRSRERLDEFARAILPTESASSLISHMLMSSELVEDRGGVRLGDEWLDKTGGDIHSNITGNGGHTVTDFASGDPIAVGVRYKGGQKMAIAGNRLHVTGVNKHEIEVRRSETGRGTAAKWSYASSAWLTGASQPQSVQRYLGFEEDEWPVIRTNRGYAAFHFGGATRKACLDLLIRRAGLEEVVEVNQYALHLSSLDPEKPTWLVDAGPATLEMGIASNLRRLENVLGRPHTNNRLPDQLRIDEVRRWLDVESQLDAIGRSRWVKPQDQGVRLKLEALLRDGE